MKNIKLFLVYPSIVLVGVGLMIAPAARLSGQVTFKRLKTFNVPGRSAEIVQYWAKGKLLLSTNTEGKSLDVFRVSSLDPPKITPIDFNDKKAGIQGIDVGGEPTSVAVHPSLPIALAVVLTSGPGRPGRIMGFDLRQKHIGRVLLSQPAGIHPDSIAISPDGQWALVANEGEGDMKSPGSIWAIDLRELKLGRKASDKPLPAHELKGLANLAGGVPIGMIEPEYVAFDPKSRFAAVSCQENDVIILVDLGGNTPTLTGSIALPRGARPDGVAILDGVRNAKGKTGCLLGVAEEGIKGRTGNAVSFYWIAPDNPRTAVKVSRSDVRPLVDASRPAGWRLDPEGIALARLKDKILAFVAIERARCVLCLDVTDPAHPTLIGKCPTGHRPEGIITVSNKGGLVVITADEGDGGPGEITFCRASVTP